MKGEEILMEKKTTAKILSIAAGAACVISLFLPWYMFFNDVHPYTILEMTDLGSIIWMAPISITNTIAMFTWIAVIATSVSALVMFLFGFRKKGGASKVVIAIPGIDLLILIAASAALFSYEAYPVYGPTIVLIATVMHIVSACRAHKAGPEGTPDRTDSQ